MMGNTIWETRQERKDGDRYPFASVQSIKDLNDSAVTCDPPGISTAPRNSPTMVGPPPSARQKPIESTSIFDDDDDGWQEMPIIRSVDTALVLDEEDQKRYKYVAPEKRVATDSGQLSGHGSNATGNLIDFDDRGQEWRAKIESNEEDYTRLKLDDDDDADDAYLRTKYLFDEDKAMTPLSQMQATKNLLTEAQRIAYVGLCSLVARQMMVSLQEIRRKELTAAIKGLDLWRLKIMGRIYYHMELETDGVSV